MDRRLAFVFPAPRLCSLLPSKATAVLEMLILLLKLHCFSLGASAFAQTALHGWSQAAVGCPESGLEKKKDFFLAFTVTNWL